VLGSDWSAASISGNVGERVHDLVMRGIRLVIDDFRADVTKTLKSGKRGRPQIAYGEPRKPDTAEPPVKWLWCYVDGARTAGELYGRALVVIAADQYACRLVVPGSQQGLPIRYGSDADRADKALAKLAGPHLPARSSSWTRRSTLSRAISPFEASISSQAHQFRLADDRRSAPRYGRTGRGAANQSHDLRRRSEGNVVVSVTPRRLGGATAAPANAGQGLPVVTGLLPLSWRLPNIGIVYWGAAMAPPRSTSCFRCLASFRS
jgi:hypothetical protein